MILDGEVQLEGLTAELRAALRHAGLRFRRSLWGRAGRIRFASVAAVPDNAELVCVLEALARLGIAFSSDFRQGWSPEDIALDLRERGKLQGALRVCGFDGSRWLVRDLPPDP